jgi:hypothetical protein
MKLLHISAGCALAVPVIKSACLGAAVKWQLLVAWLSRWTSEERRCLSWSNRINSAANTKGEKNGWRIFNDRPV